MKHIIITLNLLISSSIFGQKLQVVDFKNLPRDITANIQGTTVLDQNGQKCALLRISSRIEGLSFDVGSLGIQKVEHKADLHETWVYVPQGVKKLHISHKDYKSVNYEFPYSLKSSKTYEIGVDLEGRNITINTNFIGALIFLDGEEIGKTSVTRHLTFGAHNIHAESGKIEGNQSINVSEHSPDIINITMKDMSPYYGKVIIKVANHAEIFFNGKSCGIGSWSTELMEGTYSVVTHKTNCKNSITTFKVISNQNNEITATPPTPYHGYLQATTSPLDVIIQNKDSIVHSGEKLQLELGPQEVTYSKTGYIPLTKRYNIECDQTITDNITLKRFYNIKSNTTYAGIGMTYASLWGISVIAGKTFKNIDLEGSYTIGISSSKEVNWFNIADNTFEETSTYKINQFAFKTGYQFRINSAIGLIPQMGFRSMLLSSSGKRGQHTYCECLTLGTKLIVSPHNHLYFFINPEYALALKKSNTYSLYLQILE